MICRKLLTIGGGLVLSVALTGVAVAQDTTVTKTTTTTTKKEVVQNPDGSYSVIEYPVGKEVMVELMPSGNLANAKGMAHVMRTGDGTTVNLDLSGLDDSNYYVYAVDPTGNSTLLGPVTVENGMSKASFTTPLNQFYARFIADGRSDFNCKRYSGLFSEVPFQKVMQSCKTERQCQPAMINKWQAVVP